MLQHPGEQLWHPGEPQARSCLLRTPGDRDAITDAAGATTMKLTALADPAKQSPKTSTEREKHTNNRNAEYSSKRGQPSSPD